VHVSTAGEAFRRHHRALVAELAERAGALADGRDADPTPLVAFLKTELLPHAAGEEQHLYSAVEPLLRAHGMATATMRIDHRFLEEYIRRITEAAAALSFVPPEERARVRGRLAQIVAQLEAVFAVHLAKEEQVYLPLFEQYVTADEQARILERMHAPVPQPPSVGETVLDVRTVPPARRHPLILQTFEALGPGAAFTLVNDHDPKPLYYQFQAEHGGRFTWEYLERGPEIWRVRIGRLSVAPGGPVA
jgi:uncharacterized protein (DUF2249 family)/iron-sulfur cluster repair protein YtfE (RIC family)